MNTATISAILTTCMIMVQGLALGAELPRGWFLAGSHPKDYQLTVDRSIVHSGKASASMKCLAQKPNGFGTVLQTCRAEPFHGQRVRLSGYVRVNEVADWVGLWMRVDGSKKETVAFDNMQERPIKGTRDWTKYEIVLDVPPQSREMTFGLLLTGSGQVWLDDLKIESVGYDVPTTGKPVSLAPPTMPVNLNFEE